MIDQYPYHVCMQYMNRYVKIETTDGRLYEGVVASVDPQHVVLAIREGMEQPMGERAFGPFGFGGFFPGFRFTPFLFPFGGIRRIFPFTFVI